MIEKWRLPCCLAKQRKKDGFFVPLLPILPQMAAGLGFGPPQTARDDHQKFKCDGRQYCSEMTSREDAVYFFATVRTQKWMGTVTGFLVRMIRDFDLEISLLGAHLP